MSLAFHLVKMSLRVLADKKRKAFIKACKDPEKAQELVKEKILKETRLPFPKAIQSYADYENKKGLTQSPVLFTETTSGSTGKKKEIPYTKKFLNTFENMFLLWAHDIIFHSGLKLKSGKFFMSISPSIGEKPQDDRKYLSPSVNLLLSPFLVSHPDHSHFKTSEDFFMHIARDLLKERDVEVISIWSPTYLISLLKFIEKNQEALNVEGTDWEKIFPKLRLISCWNEAQAKTSGDLLQSYFPKVLIQGKGLLLTEAPVTIPWSGAGGHVPLLTESYLEFVQGHEVFKLHELQIGETYRVITSTINGFLRYDTKDLVRVKSFYFKTPVLEFIGRDGQYSDLAGEKLSESLLRDLFSGLDFLLLPYQEGHQQGYVLLTNNLEVPWEEKLREVHHYQLARNLQQLLPLKVMKLSPQELNLRFSTEEKNMIRGDVKERVLVHDIKEAQKFLEWIQKEYPSSQRE